MHSHLCFQAACVQDHKGKVRAVKYNLDSRHLASLSSDATMKLWDPHSMRVVGSVPLVHDKELVCLAVQGSCVAVRTSLMHRLRLLPTDAKPSDASYFLLRRAGSRVAGCLVKSIKPNAWF